MSELPGFSVIVPLYNKRPYIRRAVAGVLAQTVTDFELILVDNGSTDGSLEVLADIDDPRLRIMRQENLGPGPARNTGMQAARSAWLAFLDADDAWTPAHLKELTGLAERFPQAGLLSTSCREATGMALPRLATPDRPPSRHQVDYFVAASRRIGCINSTSAAVRRAVFEQLGGFTAARAGEDLEYWARVALHYPVALSERVTCFYFRDTNGTMQRLAQESARRRPPLSALRELSPSVAMLCDRARENPLLWKNPSIRAYVNGRLESSIKMALYHGDPDHARSVAGFMMPPLTPRQRLYVLLIPVFRFLMQPIISKFTGNP